MGIENFTASCYYLQDVINATSTIVHKRNGEDLATRTQRAGAELTANVWNTALAHQIARDTGSSLPFMAKAMAGKDSALAFDGIMETGYMLSMLHNPFGFGPMMNPMMNPMYGFGGSCFGYNQPLYSSRFMYRC